LTRPLRVLTIHIVDAAGAPCRVASPSSRSSSRAPATHLPNVIAVRGNCG
jgi:hypothetical protein